MVRRERVSQTLLFSGPEGVGKATLARRFAAVLLGDAAKIEQDDLSLEANAEIIADREKWPAEKRNEDPLFFSSHPDFVTFAPDGPLRQISIQQMRLLKNRASLKPLKGSRRVFLIDGIDRANEQAANSLLKILEEPPPHLILIATARNPYDLLTTIRSRVRALSVGKTAGGRNARLRRSARLGSTRSAGCGWRAARRAWRFRSISKPTTSGREAMLALLRVAGGVDPFGAWMKHSESIAARRSEKLEWYLEVLFILLEDVLLLAHGHARIRNEDVRARLEPVARKVSFDWLRAATARVDELSELVRRNIQKSIALDAFAAGLRPGL